MTETIDFDCVGRERPRDKGRSVARVCAGVDIALSPALHQSKSAKKFLRISWRMRKNENIIRSFIKLTSHRRQHSRLISFCRTHTAFRSADPGWIPHSTPEFFRYAPAGARLAAFRSSIRHVFACVPMLSHGNS